MRKYKFILILTPILIILDQLLKYISFKYWQNDFNIFSNIFSLVFRKNYGIAFSIPITGIASVLLTIVILVIGFYFAFHYLDLTKKTNIISLTLILSGGLGNLIDRVHLGYVIDFISISSWPVFNFADIFISLGVIFLTWKIIKE